MEDFVKQSLLYDFYSSLLTERQREIYEAYVLENYALSEIADGYGISRQAVHDIVKRCNAALEEYEEKLGLVKKFTGVKEEVAKIEKCGDLAQARKIAEHILEML